MLLEVITRDFRHTKTRIRHTTTQYYSNAKQYERASIKRFINPAPGCTIKRFIKPAPARD